MRLCGLSVRTGRRFECSTELGVLLRRQRFDREGVHARRELFFQQTVDFLVALECFEVGEGFRHDQDLKMPFLTARKSVLVTFILEFEMQRCQFFCEDIGDASFNRAHDFL